MASIIYAESNCPACGSAEVVSVQMALVERSALSFGFCTDCEWKGWEGEGRTLPLSSILSAVSARSAR